MKQAFRFLSLALVLVFAWYSIPVSLVHELYAHDDTDHQHCNRLPSDVSLESQHTHCDILNLPAIPLGHCSPLGIPPAPESDLILQNHSAGQTMEGTIIFTKQRGPPLYC